MTSAEMEGEDVMRRHHTSRRLLGFALVAVIAMLSFRPFTSVQAATERQRLGFPSMIPTEPTVQIGGVNLGNLPDYLFFFADAHTDANWQGATKGFVGDVAVDGVEASERTSGGVPYAGTIFTNDTTLSA